jgi:hypothetical protein
LHQKGLLSGEVVTALHAFFRPAFHQKVQVPGRIFLTPITTTTAPILDPTGFSGTTVWVWHVIYWQVW